MGYYSDFFITASGYKDLGDYGYSTYPLPQKLIDDIDKEFDELFGHACDCTTYEAAWEYYGIKWYDWQDDMVLLSSKFPSVLFKVEGEGENSGDLWRAYFVNGSMQYEQAQIVYGDFSPSLLKEMPIPEGYPE